MPRMTIGRRKLLLVGGGLIAASCGPQTNRTLPALISAGKVTDLATGTLRAISGMGVAIGRDAQGIYALSLICTHAGCDISVDGSVSTGSIGCACHGSVFDGQGAVVRGPASAPLAHLVVTADAQGNLTIHGDQPTAASTRLPA
jgi:cytochrome b6-f complex iron-sulfur subunit